MDGLSYTTIIEIAEPLARRRGSALDRYATRPHHTKISIPRKRLRLTRQANEMTAAPIRPGLQFFAECPGNVGLPIYSRPASPGVSQEFVASVKTSLSGGTMGSGRKRSKAL
jgi:hypothetical protein